ncbi:uncharacterized protein LOC114358183 [Ostrinia furnacalis]|uniref:uncharacterized protein LOC114358183 n=1 Tax=Ostrinia furnacalis TaxID=93504 RepID=UPI00103C9B78|nr:uncharacterized protein LOC114358183 [Ostrinia furnacalis]
MAVMRSANIPDDAVLLDEMEATKHAWEFVTNWETPSDTWALRYGPGILGGVNAVSGLIINRHYRTKLKLGLYGFLASAIPISIMPGVLTPLFHRYLVSTNMLLMKDGACPMCYELRSIAVQCGLGIAYPMVLGPLSGLMFAHRYGTARIPDLREGPKVVLQFVRKLTRPFTATLTFLAVAQVVASSVITYYEMKNNITLKRKVMEIEKMYEEDLARNQ